MKRYLLILIFAFVVVWSNTAFAKQKWYSAETHYFVFHYPEHLEAAAKRLVPQADSVHEMLSKKYQWTPRAKTQVVLSDVQDEANGYSLFIPYNYMVIYASAPRPDEPLGNYDDWLKMVFIHEYTHVLHIDQYGGAIAPFRWVMGKLVAPNGLTPAWLREGLATYEETMETTAGRGRSTLAEMIVRGAVLENKFPKLEQAQGFQWAWPGPLMPYYYGVKFLQYLADTYGEEKIHQLNRRISRRLTFFMLNHHAKKVFGKTFPELWKEWQQVLQTQYATFKEQLEKAGVTPFDLWLKGDGNLQSPALSPDGKKVAYLSYSPTRAPELRLREGEKDRRLLRRAQGITRLSFSPDGNQLVFAGVSLYKRRYVFRELYLLDLPTGKLRKLTKRARARDPVFTPDGKSILFVSQEGGTDGWREFSLESNQVVKRPPPLEGLPSGGQGGGEGEGELFQQISHPSISPDGQQLVAVSRREMTKGEGTWDLRLYDREGKPLRWLTTDTAIEMHPVWLDSNRLMFVSDATNIPNIYLYDLKQKKISRMTNVLTGVFYPQMDAEGNLFVQYFHGNGFDLRKTRAEQLFPLPFVPSHKGRGEMNSPAPSSFTQKEYSPFRKPLFTPRYLAPFVLNLGDTWLLQVVTHSYDPIRRHRWFATAHIRTDNQFVGTNVSYTYDNLPILLGTGFNRYSVDFGNLRFEVDPANPRTVHFFEQRHGGFVSATLPFAPHSFSLAYSYEDRAALTSLTALEKSRLNLGGYAGFSATYSTHDVSLYPASISWEEGRRVRFTGIWSDATFGASRSNEQRVFSGDWREYIRLPGWRHVLALRAAGGMTWGDQLVQGNFTLGGALGELPFSRETNAFYLPLRGLPNSFASGSRVTLFTAEYRLPLISPQRAFLISPIFLKNLHAAAFGDFGDVWVKQTAKPFAHFFDRFMLGVGGELRGDFVINPGFPLFIRTGYAILVYNQNRVAGNKDPLLKSDMKNGVFIFQFGTAF